MQIPANRSLLSHYNKHWNFTHQHWSTNYLSSLFCLAVHINYQIMPLKCFQIQQRGPVQWFTVKMATPLTSDLEKPKLVILLVLPFGHFPMEVSGDWYAFGASLKWLWTLINVAEVVVLMLLTLVSCLCVNSESVFCRTALVCVYQGKENISYKIINFYPECSHLFLHTGSCTVPGTSSTWTSLCHSS